VFFDPDFPDQKSLREIVERHDQVLFQLFNQEGLRVDSLHLKIDPNATFSMQEPCQFFCSDILGSLKVMIDQLVGEGLLIPDISCSHASPLVIVHKMKGGKDGSKLSGGLSILTGIG